MSRIRIHLALTGAALTAILIAAACFSEHTPAGPDNSALCSNAGGSVVNGSTLVIIRDFAFDTENVSVQAGGTVTWVNCESADAAAHTSTSDQGVWSSPLLASGDVFTVRFDNPGVFPYHCEPHPFMTGTVTVQ
jgi:plastocyanin